MNDHAKMVAQIFCVWNLWKWNPFTVRYYFEAISNDRRLSSIWNLSWFYTWRILNTWRKTTLFLCTTQWTLVASFPWLKKNHRIGIRKIKIYVNLQMNSKVGIVGVLVILVTIPWGRREQPFYLWERTDSNAIETSLGFHTIPTCSWAQENWFTWLLRLE